MKTAFWSLVLGLAVLTLVGSAQAQIEQTPNALTITKWPSQIEQCFEHCESEGIIAHRSKTGDNSAAMRRAQERASAAVERAQTEVRSNAGNLAKLRAEVGQLRSAIEKLEREVGLLKAKSHDSERVALELTIINLKLSLETRLTALENAPVQEDGDAAAIAQLKDELADLNARLTQSEQRVARPVRLGPQAGIILLTHGFGHESGGYSGFPLGVRLTFALGSRLDLAISADALLAHNEMPFGSRVRAALNLAVINRTLGIEFGTSGLMVGYDRQFDARAAYLLQDVSVTARPPYKQLEHLRVEGGFDFGLADSVKLGFQPAFGCHLLIGWEF